MRYLCIVYDLEDNFKITGFQTIKDNDYFNKEIFLEVDKKSFETLKEKFKNNSITYPKDSEKFDMSKVVFTEEDPLHLYKYESKMKVISKYKENFTNLDSFLFLKYFALSAELLDKNISMYIGNIDRIVEDVTKREDNKLLAKVLDLREVILEIEIKMKSYDDLRLTLKNIKNANSVDKIDQIIAKAI